MVRNDSRVGNKQASNVKRDARIVNEERGSSFYKLPRAPMNAPRSYILLSQGTPHHTPCTMQFPPSKEPLLMFDDIFERFGGLDTKKITETVNFVWTHRAQLADLIERLPQLLRDTGESIESAGGSAVKAAQFLTGGANSEGGVRHLSAVAADALHEGQQELGEVAEMLSRIGKELDAINIPSFKPHFTEIAGFRVVSGVDMGRESLFDDVVERMQGGSERLTAMSRNLQTVSTQLREMGGLLAGMGEDMGRVGTQLQDSGKTLRSLGSFGADKADQD